MLVKWNGKGPLAIGDPRTGSNYKLAAVIVLTPGVNKLDDDVWHRAMKKDAENSELVRLLKRGSKGGLEVVDAVKDEKAAKDTAKNAETKQESVDLTGFGAKDAAAIVKQTLNKELLEQWAESDNRPLVRRAVEQQLKKLTIVPKKQGTDDGDDAGDESSED